MLPQRDAKGRITSHTPDVAALRAIAESTMADWFLWDDQYDGLPDACCRYCDNFKQARMRETTPAFMRSELDERHTPTCLTHLAREFLVLTAPPDAAAVWPVCDVMAKLADAADHLLRDHDCDVHGYEGIAAARDAARRMLVTPPDAAAVERVIVTASAVVSVWQNDGRTHESNPRFTSDLDTAMELLRAALAAGRAG